MVHLGAIRARRRDLGQTQRWTCKVARGPPPAECNAVVGVEGTRFHSKREVKVGKRSSKDTAAVDHWQNFCSQPMSQHIHATLARLKYLAGNFRRYARAHSR